MLRLARWIWVCKIKINEEPNPPGTNPKDLIPEARRENEFVKGFGGTG